MKMRQTDATHCNCTGHDALGCIENQLYKKKMEHMLLVGLLDELTKADQTNGETAQPSLL
jgi:hypothetical protein